MPTRKVRRPPVPSRRSDELAELVDREQDGRHYTERKSRDREPGQGTGGVVDRVADPPAEDDRDRAGRADPEEIPEPRRSFAGLDAVRAVPGTTGRCC